MTFSAWRVVPVVLLGPEPQCDVIDSRFLLLSEKARVNRMNPLGR